MALKCKIITCGKVNKKIFLIVVGGLMFSLQLFIESQSEIFNGEKNAYPIIYTMMYSISLCLSFSLLIIFNVYNKKKKITSTLIEDKESNILITNDIPQKKIIFLKEKLLWILLVSIIDFTANLFSSIYWLENDNYVDTLQTNIIFMALFAYLILKLKLYKHHVLCIIVVLIRSLSYTLIFQVFFKETKIDMIPYIVSFVTEIAFSLTYVMYKYYMLIKYMHPYEIMFFEGLIELIFSIIALVIANKLDELDNLTNFIFDFKGIEIVKIIAWLFVSFIYHALLFKVIDIFGPFYIHISIIISEFINLFFKEKEDFTIPKIIFYVLSFIICPFMILVFLEIIELNFCGLSYMTKKNIELRAQLDSIINDENNKSKNIENDKKENDEQEISVGEDEYSIAMNHEQTKSKNLISRDSVDDSFYYY